MDRFAAQARSTPRSLRLGVSQILPRLRAWHILVLAFALRLPLVWLRRPSMHTESINAGFTLAQHGYLGDPYPIIATGPTAHLAPAYPLIVAAVRSITPSD